MDKKNPSGTVNFFYIVGIFVFFIALIVFLLIRYTNFAQWFLNDTPDCYVERMTGMYCPGCGLSRSVIAFCQFKFLKSFVAHPLVIYSAVSYLYLMIKETIYRYAGGRPVTDRLFLTLVYGAVALTIIQWILKVIFVIIV